MSDYNVVDVTILEEIYLKLRPWIKKHPNIGNLMDVNKVSCSICGHTDLETMTGNYYYTSIGKY